MIKLIHVTANGYHSMSQQTVIIQELFGGDSIIYKLKEQFTGQDNTTLGSSKTLRKLDIA